MKYVCYQIVYGGRLTLMVGVILDISSRPTVLTFSEEIRESRWGVWVIIFAVEVRPSLLIAWCANFFYFFLGVQEEMEVDACLNQEQDIAADAMVRPLLPMLACWGDLMNYYRTWIPYPSRHQMTWWARYFLTYALDLTYYTWRTRWFSHHAWVALRLSKRRWSVFCLSCLARCELVLMNEKNSSFQQKDSTEGVRGFES